MELPVKSKFNYSHKLNQVTSEALMVAVSECKNKLRGKSIYSAEELYSLIKLVDELSTFDLGKFLLVNRGLNGYWTDYVVNFPRNQINSLALLEQKLLSSSVFNATYERQQIFKQENQKQVVTGANLAAIPCGLMSELLDLDFSLVDNIQLSGIDLDTDSLQQSRLKTNPADDRIARSYVTLDAFSLDINEEFDLISSNGLTIYLADDELVVKLFSKFHKALKPGGKLVTSFLTYPAQFGEISEVISCDVNPNDAIAKLIFVDALEVTWNCYRSSVQMESLLSKAGFSRIKIIGDSKYIFPTCVAEKIK